MLLPWFATHAEEPSNAAHTGYSPTGSACPAGSYLRSQPTSGVVGDSALQCLWTVAGLTGGCAVTPRSLVFAQYWLNIYRRTLGFGMRLCHQGSRSCSPARSGAAGADSALACEIVTATPMLAHWALTPFSVTSSDVWSHTMGYPEFPLIFIPQAQIEDATRAARGCRP